MRKSEQGIMKLRRYLSVWLQLKYIIASDFDVHVTVHSKKFLIIKPTRFTNFSNLLLEYNSTCFGQFLCPSLGVFHCTHSNGICQTPLLTAVEQDQGGKQFHPDPARKLYDISCLT